MFLRASVTTSELEEQNCTYVKRGWSLTRFWRYVCLEYRNRCSWDLNWDLNHAAMIKHIKSSSINFSAMSVCFHHHAMLKFVFHVFIAMSQNNFCKQQTPIMALLRFLDQSPSFLIQTVMNLRPIHQTERWPRYTR